MVLVVYLIARFAGYFFRVAYWLMGKEQPRGFGRTKRETSRYKKRQDENLDMYVPSDRKERKEFKGGEYVDFEEVKEEKQ